MGEPTAKLVAEFSSLLDETTILSICSDYDLADSRGFADAKDVLATLSQTVEIEEATGFNPSGIGADSVLDITQLSLNGGDEAPPAVPDSDLRSNDGQTTTTESSQSQSLFSTSSKNSTQESDLVYGTIFDDLSDEQKETQLLNMFTTLKPVDVKLTLKKAKGDADLAINELLNLTMLEEAGERVKGVDAFYVADDATSAKKRKGKKKKKTTVRAAEPRSPVSADAPEDLEKIEETNQKNVACLAECLSLPEAEASSIYHQNGASMGATILEVISNYKEFSYEVQLSMRLLSAKEELSKAFPWVPSEHIVSILEITASRDYAGEIVKILGDYYERPAYLKFDVPYSVASSLADDELISSHTATPPKAKPAVQASRSVVANGKVLAWNQPTSLQSAMAQTANSAALRDHAYSAAASASRRGRSDPLFRQATGFYAERAREEARAHRQALSAEAEYRVDQNSTKDLIDLHGVTVQDGVNIALNRVWSWWNSLGEERVHKAKQGFTVVTGIGRHSADGRSRLRTNVCKALVADGWRVEVLTGRFLVTGRKR